MRRPVLLSLVDVLALVPLVPLATAGASKPVRGTATIDLRVTLTRLDVQQAAGMATFTGTLRNGTPITGEGTVTFPTALRGGKLRPIGTGTLRFTAVSYRANGGATRIRGGRASLPFLGGQQEGTGIFWDDLTLSFLGTSTEGTGI
jgi:hypothetical protein